MQRVPLFLTGWSDFFMTIAEAWLPHMGVPRLARYVAERHYATGLHGPGAKDAVLARIEESAGDLRLAEGYLRRAAAVRPEMYAIVLGQFLERTGRKGAAIEAFERAREVTRHTSDLEFLQRHIAELRRDASNP